jgi:hypothetical protein
MMDKAPKNLRGKLNSRVSDALNSRGANYAETTLREDVFEANREVGEHIDSLTRRSTLIQERLIAAHPDVSIRMISRILSKSAVIAD